MIGDEADWLSLDLDWRLSAHKREHYARGVTNERARVRQLLAKHVERLRTFDGYVLESSALDAILSGEVAAIASGEAMPLEAAVAESGKGEVERE